MTDYELNVLSWKGTVAVAVHYRGVVKGPYPESCHGGTRYNAPEHRGKTTCFEGHELPEREEWDVEAAWTEERFGRWSAKHFDGDGPGQFLSEARVILSARRRFLGLDPVRWWERDVVPGKPGDRLLYDDEVIAAVPPAEGTETPGETAARRKEAAARAERMALLELRDRYPYLDWDGIKIPEAAS
jgi:hypothetical protein